MSKSNKSTKKVEPPKSGAPMLIIGVVLIAAMLGGWYLYTNSQTKSASNANAASNSSVANANKAKTTSTVPPNAPAGAQPPNQAGSPSATVVLEEFADFQCGSCAAANPTMSEIKSLFGSRINFIFRNYPLQIPAHDKSFDAAVAAEAAGMQSSNKFWEMQHLLFSNQQSWTSDPNYKQVWKGYAQKIGLDVSKWENDFAGFPARGRVEADLARGKALNVNSTPTLYVNGQAVQYGDMNVQTLKAMIEAELSRSTPAGTSGKPTPPASNAPSAP